MGAERCKKNAPAHNLPDRFVSSRAEPEGGVTLALRAGARRKQKSTARGSPSRGRRALDRAPIVVAKSRSETKRSSERKGRSQEAKREARRRLHQAKRSE